MGTTTTTTIATITGIMSKYRPLLPMVTESAFTLPKLTVSEDAMRPLSSDVDIKRLCTDLPTTDDGLSGKTLQAEHCSTSDQPREEADTSCRLGVEPPRNLLFRPRSHFAEIYFGFEHINNDADADDSSDDEPDFFCRGKTKQVDPDLYLLPNSELSDQPNAFYEGFSSVHCVAAQEPTDSSLDGHYVHRDRDRDSSDKPKTFAIETKQIHPETYLRLTSRDVRPDERDIRLLNRLDNVTARSVNRRHKSTLELPTWLMRGWYQ